MDWDGAVMDGNPSRIAAAILTCWMTSRETSPLVERMLVMPCPPPPGRTVAHMLGKPRGLDSGRRGTGEPARVPQVIKKIHRQLHRCRYVQLYDCSKIQPFHEIAHCK